MYRLGVDVGGTFTDAVLIDEATGEIRATKVLSTPREPASGFAEAVRRILEGVDPGKVRFLVHGTTVATNALIEGKTARTAFLTTAGFRDLLEIARQIRPSLYDLHFEKPRPLVPRHLCFGIRERLDARGQVLVPLAEEQVRQVAAQLRQEGVEAVAVCFLHSYVNPAHEQRAGQILREELPEMVISLSCQVAPEPREYLRASTTVVNACVQPVVRRYLQDIEARLQQEGIGAELLVMQSSGGVFTFAAAGEKPVFMVESGPAAGVIAAAQLGAHLGRGNILSFDMGGTTAKAGLVQGGAPRVTREYEMGAAARAGTGAGRGSGYPIRTPVVDLAEIGAGGGSIAWVDAGGILRVGPHSAGADPGPACYGRDGMEPAVTDANLALGRLNPRYFLGGELELDVEAARRAIAEKCAGPLGMGAVEAAHGIVELANAAMANALRLISVQRGYDPRDFALVAFGGAGPAHANRLAMELQIPLIVIPPSPGTFSALGLLVADLEHEYAATVNEQVEGLDPRRVEHLYREMEAQGRAALEREGVAAQDMAFVRQADLRYAGQGYELSVQFAAGPGQLTADFHRAHAQAYGFSAPAEPVECVALRLKAIGRIARPQLRRAGAGRNAGPKERRPVYFAEAGGYVDCPIWDRYALGEGDGVRGPAVVEERDSTTVIHPGYQALVDGFGNLLLRAI